MGDPSERASRAASRAERIREAMGVIKSRSRKIRSIERAQRSEAHQPKRLAAKAQRAPKHRR